MQLIVGLRYYIYACNVTLNIITYTHGNTWDGKKEREKKERKKDRHLREMRHVHVYY